MSFFIMKSDKELKKEFKIIASKDPEKYYAVNALKNNGFLRQQCSNCNKYFWSTDKRDVCGDAECMKKVTLFEKNPSRKRMSYIDVWNKYKEHFHKLGYSVINRYPVVAKWNPTTDFTIASIAAFQPYVISGEVEAPAKKLVIPQFCLRFGDIDNVGITGSHLTGFVMIGQHAFVKPEEWNQEKFFMDIYSYVTGVVGLSKDELILHEDAWAGAANYGPCMEFFSNGIELFNQVYMMFEHRDEGDRELKIKVLDMGLGMERIAWFSQGTATSYDAVFPTVLEYLIETTKVDYDQELFRSVAPYASLLNLDESTDINKAWKSIADNLSLSVEELKSKILPMTAIYSIAEHSRALLLAITDGALPSNVGGFYNLRVIFRRMMSFIDKFKWEIDMKKLLRIHAIFLEPIFPELQESVNEVNEILEYEKKKYYENKQRTKAIIENKAIDFLKKIGRYPEELGKGTVNVIYLKHNPGNENFINVEKSSLAQLVEVDFQRPDIDGYSVVTPKFFTSQNYVIMLFQGTDYQIIKSQISFFEKSEEQVGTYLIKTGDEAWSELNSGLGFVVAGTQGQQNIVIKDMKLRYFDPDIYQSYLQPVYVFLGEGNFAAYVPAVKE